MKKEKEKTYLAFTKEWNKETQYKRMTGDEIRSFVKKYKGYQEFIAIVDGNLIKGFNSKIDLTRL